jgi:hypothetical protein
MLGYKTSRYDTDYLQYKNQKDERERLLEELRSLGIVSGYSGYGYNTFGAEANFPELAEYLRGAR